MKVVNMTVKAAQTPAKQPYLSIVFPWSLACCLNLARSSLVGITDMPEMARFRKALALSVKLERLLFRWPLGNLTFVSPLGVISPLSAARSGVLCTTRIGIASANSGKRAVGPPLARNFK